MGDSKPLVNLAWPIYIDVFLQFLVTNIGQMMVGRYAPEAVAAIGNANQILNIMYIILSTIAMASTILISLRVGSHEQERAQRVFSTTLAVNATVGLLLSIIVICFHAQLFALLQVPETVAQQARSYMLIVGSLLWLHGISLALVACLKSYSMLPHIIIVALVMNACAIIGNILFIGGFGPIPPMNINGVAVATVLSRIAGLVALLIIFRRNVPVTWSWEKLKPFPRATISRIFRIGIPVGVEDLSYNIAQFVIMAMINMLGTQEVTARVYAGILATFCYLTSSALGQASQVISAQLAGAGSMDRVGKQMRITATLAIVSVIVITLAVYLLRKPIMGVFTTDQYVISLVSSILVIELWLEVSRTVNIIMVRTMQSVGDVVYPVKVGLIAMWTIQVGLSYVLGLVFNLGLIGIWIAMALDETVRASLFVIRWGKGHWRDIASRFSSANNE